MTIRWRWGDLSDFSAAEWHAVGVFRQAIFVVEQRCPYPDLDALDPLSRHLAGYDDDGRLVAYLRLVPPGLKYPAPSLGRIALATTARGIGNGRALVREGLAEHQRRYAGQPNTIGAQAYLTQFYRSLGFEPCSDIYLEDEIPHLDMTRLPEASE